MEETHLRIARFLAVFGMLASACTDPGEGSTSQDIGSPPTDGVTFADNGPTPDSGPPPDGAVADGTSVDATTPDADPPDGTATPDVPVTQDTGGTPDGGPVGGVGPLISVDPVEHTYSYVAPLAAPLSKQITIANAGDEPLIITGLTFDPSGSADFDMTLVPPLPKTLAPGKTTMVFVRFQNIEGGLGWLDIASNDPNTPVQKVQLDSYLKATTGGTPPVEPCIDIQPGALNFGQVQRGNTKVLSAVLTNCGSIEPVTITDIKRSQILFLGPLTDEFQIVNEPATPFTIQPGASYPLDVSYTPQLAGPDSGYFEFTTNAAGQTKVQLDVAGLGTEPPPEEIGLTIKLYWDSDDTDVDSHLLAPGGTFFDCVTDNYFGNPSPDWGTQGDWMDDPFLDVDDVDGFGPEHINISEPQPGTYTYMVHYWDDTFGDSFSQAANATVEVYSYNQLIATYGPEHLAHTDRTWDVFTIEWPSLNITPLGNVYTTTQTGGFCFP